MTESDKTPALDIGVEGMTCAACVRRVENGLRKLPSVIEASVNLATERAHIQFDHAPGADDAQSARDLIRKLGYQPVDLNSGVAEERRERHHSETERLWKSFIYSAFFTLPLLLLAMLPMMSARVMAWQMSLMTIQGWNWVMLVLALPVQFWFGWQFLRLGAKSLLALSPDMNALVLIGTVAAFAYSALVTFAPGSLPVDARHVYFEASAVVITLVLLGKYLETRSRHQAADAMQFLLRLVPKSAVVIRNRLSKKIAVDEIVVGDLIEVPPGSTIAVDGLVENGATYIDQSMVTGEPMPVSKQVGDTVIAGTINTNGTIQFRAQAVGADTTLAKIVAFVESAQATKPRIQGIADRVVAYFVPIVLLVSLVTAIAWLWIVPGGSIDQAMIHAVAVLIIACPCAMGLAVPTSVMVGTGRAAQLGILFRSTEAVQSLSEIDTVAFDKTGTLTAGKPELVQLRAFAPFDQDALLNHLSLIQQRSEHPLASAVVAAAKSRSLKSFAKIEHFTAIAGAGVEATLDNGDHYLIGSDKLMRERSIDVTPAVADIATAGSSGHGFFFAAVNGKLAAVMVIADPVKHDSKAAVEQLVQSGLDVALISGDNSQTASSVAVELGIATDRVFAEILPNEKARVIQTIQQQQRRVAFVGDGLNDAPALAVADVGVAMGTGTDLAIESADVIAMSGDIQKIPQAIELARRVMANIRQNLLWAFGYNILLIPVATGLLKPWLGFDLSPLIAGAAMSLSSFLVVTNALRLRGVSFPSSVHC